MQLADVLVVNYGIHYSGDLELYEKHLAHLFYMVRAAPIISSSACALALVVPPHSSSPGSLRCAFPALSLPFSFPQLEDFSLQSGKVAIFRETSADHLPYRADKPPAGADPTKGFIADAEADLPPTAQGCRCAPTDERRNATAKYRQLNSILDRISHRCDM